MKPTIVLFLLCATLTAWPLHAKADSKPMDEILKHYLVIQKQLAADKMDQVTAESKTIEDLSGNDPKLQDVKRFAADLEKSKDLKEAREKFKGLSLPVVAWAKKAKPTGMTIMHCPMAKANWVQDSDKVHNPFYTGDMSTCGSKLD